MGPFNCDPRAIEAPIQRIATPPALHYDGQLKDWQLDSNGAPVDAHPVDVGMVLSFIDPHNNKFQTIKYLGSPNLQKQIEDMAANAQPAQRLIAAKLARIISVTHEETTRGLKIFVKYRNLVTNEENTAISG
jgi:hypothetical protein